MSTESERSVADLSKRVEKLEGSRSKKDCWDKVNVIGTLATALLIPGVLGYATYTWNRQQNAEQTHFAKVEALTRFAPLLASDNAHTQALGIIGIRELVDMNFAVSVAVQSPSDGAELALQHILQTVTEPQERLGAKRALVQVREGIALRLAQGMGGTISQDDSGAIVGLNLIRCKLPTDKLHRTLRNLTELRSLFVNVTDFGDSDLGEALRVASNLIELDLSRTKGCRATQEINETAESRTVGCTDR
jgi:hypothetical protein